MQQLYHLATLLAIPADSYIGEERSVSITYTGYANSDRDGMTAWFIRDPFAQMPKPEASEPVESRATKKRTMRAGKKRDLANFLGAFG
jgi:hypothetical protein